MDISGDRSTVTCELCKIIIIRAQVFNGVFIFVLKLAIEDTSYTVSCTSKNDHLDGGTAWGLPATALDFS